MGIRLLYPFGEKENDVDLNASLNLDIIAVHGLGGDPIKTWTDPKSQKLWLRDLLPRDIPHARIMTFGYNATPAFENSVAGIEDHARDLLRYLREMREGTMLSKRPIIFIGHSLGGLVIKQALVTSSNSPDYTSVCQSTIGTIFFGTPHGGSSLASYAALLARIATAFALKPNPQLLLALPKGSPPLSELTDEYKRLVDQRPFEVVSFYETKTMRGQRHLIVSKESAILGSPGRPWNWETPIPVNATHREICRFSSTKDSTYKTAMRSMQRMRHEYMGVQVNNEHYIIPHAVNSNFTGRKAIRQQLTDSLLSERYGGERTQSRFVLYGLGGSGKTQICLKFANDFKERFWGVFWIDASSNSTAEQGLLSIARACRLSSQVDNVKEFLSTKEHWLLIIDNADDIDIDISKYFPPGTKGTILITTRNPNFQKYSTAGSYHVDELEKEDAVELLLKTSSLEKIEDNDEKEKARKAAAEKVVETLGCLALAIIQAGAVIRQRMVNLDGFCELYSKSSKELLELGRPDSSIEDKRSVYTTWEISIQMIEKIEEKHALLALELLRHFAFMHFTGISESIFESSVNNMKIATDTQAGFTPTSLLLEIMPSGWDQLLMSQALSVLVSFSLVAVDDSRCISMHPLVHQWSRDRMSIEGQGQAWKAAVETMAMASCWNETAADIQMRRTLLPHIDACLSEGEDQLFLDGIFRGHLLHAAITFSKAYQENDRPNVVKFAQRTLVSVEKSFPRGHAYHLSALRNLALNLEVVGRCKEAIALREEVLQLVRENCLSPSAIVFDTINIAKGYFAARNYTTAIDVCERVRREFLGMLGEDNILMIHALETMGGSKWFMDNPKEARKDLEKAWSLRKKIFGPGPNSAGLAATGWLAEVYLALKQRKKAIIAHEHYIQLATEIYGPDNVTTLNAISRTEDYLYKYRYLLTVRRKAKRIAPIEEVIRGFQNYDGEIPSYSLDCMQDLAWDYFITGWSKKGVELQEQVVRYRIQQWGEDDLETKKSLKLLKMWRRIKAAQKVCYFWIPDRILDRGLKI